MAIEPIPEFNPTTSVIASLASVALRRGIDIAPESLVPSYVLGKDALTTAKLIAVARDIGLDAKKLRPGKWARTTICRTLGRPHNFAEKITGLSERFDQAYRLVVANLPEKRQPPH